MSRLDVGGLVNVISVNICGGQDSALGEAGGFIEKSGLTG